MAAPQPSNPAPAPAPHPAGTGSSPIGGGAAGHLDEDPPWRRRTRRLLAVAGLLALVYALFRVLPAPGTIAGTNPWRSPDGRRPLIIAHGGGQGLHPDNTLPAFIHSSTSGCDVLEMDLRLSRDGVLVTLHDATVDRTSDGKGRAIDLTVAELKALNFGHRFKDPTGRQPYREQPARLGTLEEIFTHFSKWPMVIELKDRGADGERAAETLARQIERHGMTERVIVASFDDATLAAFRRQSGGKVATAPAMEATRKWVLLSKAGLDWFAPSGDHALQIPVAKAGHRLDTPALIRAAHRRNLAVHYWTINDPAEMKRLIALGADGLITDRPDLLRGVLEDLGLGASEVAGTSPTR